MYVDSITAGIVGISSVTSAHKVELLLQQMRMLNKLEFAISAWYVHVRLNHFKTTIGMSVILFCVS